MIRTLTFCAAAILITLGTGCGPGKEEAAIRALIAQYDALNIQDPTELAKPEHQDLRQRLIQCFSNSPTLFAAARGRVIAHCLTAEAKAEETLCSSYSRAGAAQSAFEHYQRLEGIVLQVTAGGFDPGMVYGLQVALVKCRFELPPIFLTNEVPRPVPEMELAQVLAAAAARAGLPGITNPFTCTADLQRWAEQLTRGATNDLQKAKLINDALAQRPNQGAFESWTALSPAHVFSDWNQTNLAFRCQDLANLYLVLARAAGLNVYLVQVMQTYDGDCTPHACAAVVISGQTVLADPSYWFGVPHRRISILDDIQAVAEYLSTEPSLAERKAATELAANIQIIHVLLFNFLLDEGHLSEAREEFKIIQRLDPDSALANSTQAKIALLDKDTNAALAHITRAIKLAPRSAGMHVQAGDIYLHQGRLEEALHMYQAAINLPTDKTSLNEIRPRIEMIKASLCFKKGDLDCAFTGWNNLIASGCVTPEIYYNRALVRDQQDDPDDAINDYSKALELNPKMAEAYFGRGRMKQKTGDQAGATTDYRKAIELNPKFSNYFSEPP